MEIICYAIGCSLSILCCTVTSIAIQHETELELERNGRIESNLHQYEYKDNYDDTELDTILYKKVSIIT